MKKMIFLSITFFFLFQCGTEQADVERIMEDGVEVVINHLEPYRIRGESSKLRLEEEFTIDPERDEMAELGLTDINSFEVDSEGNIYFFQGREFDLDVVFKFDKEGNFLKTFGRMGQGPGEIQFPQLLCITEKDEIPIQDGNTQKLYIFDTEGALIRETRIEQEEGFGNFVFSPLENGNYLKYGGYFDPESQHRQNILQLYNPKVEELKELDRCDHGKVIAFTQQKKIFTPRVFICQILGGMIFVGHEKRGYEILVYDLEGNLLKKIRKGYNPAGTKTGSSFPIKCLPSIIFSWTMMDVSTLKPMKKGRTRASSGMIFLILTAFSLPERASQDMGIGFIPEIL